MSGHRLWCFLVHRWLQDTDWSLWDGAYVCCRCGEKWDRP